MLNKVGVFLLLFFSLGRSKLHLPFEFNHITVSEISHGDLSRSRTQFFSVPKQNSQCRANFPYFSFQLSFADLEFYRCRLANQTGLFIVALPRDHKIHCKSVFSSSVVVLQTFYEKSISPSCSLSLPAKTKTHFISTEGCPYGMGESKKRRKAGRKSAVSQHFVLCKVFFFQQVG